MKTAIFIGSARDDLRAFPPEVRRVMGLAIKDAQEGREHLRAKELKGFGGRSVLEIVDDLTGTRLGPSTPFGSPRRYMSSTPFKRNRDQASRPDDTISILSEGAF